MDISALSGGLQSSRFSARETASAKGATETGAVGADDQAASKSSAAPAGAEGLYISPVLKYDQSARVAVLYFRDFDTGETRDQIPAKKVVDQYRQSVGERSSNSGSSNDRNGGNVTGGEDGASGGAVASSPGIGASFLDGPGGVPGGGASPAAGAGDGSSVTAPASPTPTSGGASGGDGPATGAAGSLLSVTV